MEGLVTAALLLADFDGHMGWDGDSGWGIAMVVGMVLIWVLLIAAGVWLFRELGPRASRGAETPLELLDRRLAEGAIDPQDYAERKAILRGEQPPG